MDLAVGDREVEVVERTDGSEGLHEAFSGDEGMR